MSVWWVHRPDGPGTSIAWAGTYEQPGYAEEQLDDATSAELQTFLNPAPTQAQQVAAVVGAGLAIVSTATPALNGTYGIGPPEQQNISGIAAGIASRDRLPGGGATFDYGDAANVLHTFTGPNFLNFAAAVEDFLYNLDRGSPPTQPVTIP